LKLLLDTNVYIDWLRAGMHEQLFAVHGVFRYLSSVVMLALLAGATNPRALAGVRQIVSVHERTQRILTPTAKVSEEAGLVLATLRKQKVDVAGRGFVNDVLIAMTARHSGATVATHNRGDFERIRSVRPFALHLL